MELPVLEHAELAALSEVGGRINQAIQEHPDAEVPGPNQTGLRLPNGDWPLRSPIWIPNGHPRFLLRGAPPTGSDGTPTTRLIWDPAPIRLLTVVGDRHTNDPATRVHFTVEVDGATTTPLQYKATALELRVALEALSTVPNGSISVTGGPGNAEGSSPYVLCFRTVQSDKDLPDLDAQAIIPDELVGSASISPPYPGPTVDNDHNVMVRVGSNRVAIEDLAFAVQRGQHCAAAVLVSRVTSAVGRTRLTNCTFQGGYLRDPQPDQPPLHAAAVDHLSFGEMMAGVRIGRFRPRDKEAADHATPSTNALSEANNEHHLISGCRFNHLSVAGILVTTSSAQSKANLVRDSTFAGEARVDHSTLVNLAGTGHIATQPPVLPPEHKQTCTAADPTEDPASAISRYLRAGAGGVTRRRALEQARIDLSAGIAPSAVAQALQAIHAPVGLDLTTSTELTSELEGRTEPIEAIDLMPLRAVAVEQDHGSWAMQRCRVSGLTSAFVAANADASGLAIRECDLIDTEHCFHAEGAAVYPIRVARSRIDPGLANYVAEPSRSWVERVGPGWRNSGWLMRAGTSNPKTVSLRSTKIARTERHLDDRGLFHATIELRVNENSDADDVTTLDIADSELPFTNEPQFLGYVHWVISDPVALPSLLDACSGGPQAVHDFAQANTTPILGVVVPLITPALVEVTGNGAPHITYRNTRLVAGGPIAGHVYYPAKHSPQHTCEACYDAGPISVAIKDTPCPK